MPIMVWDIYDEKGYVLWILVQIKDIIRVILYLLLIFILLVLLYNIIFIILSPERGERYRERVL